MPLICHTKFNFLLYKEILSYFLAGISDQPFYETSDPNVIFKKIVGGGTIYVQNVILTLFWYPNRLIIFKNSFMQMITKFIYNFQELFFADTWVVKTTQLGLNEIKSFNQSTFRAQSKQLFDKGRKVRYSIAYLRTKAKERH